MFVKHKFNRLWFDQNAGDRDKCTMPEQPDPFILNKEVGLMKLSIQLI